MTASPDDAAASDSPPRADVGPAAPSFPGSPGRRRPEDHPMPQHPPTHDETVRMRGDGPSGRPTLEGQRVTSPAPATATGTATSTAPATGQTPVHAQAAAQSAAPANRPQDHDAVPEREFDDTRPVTRAWLQGAPETDTRSESADATAVVSPQPLGDQEDATQQF